MWPAAARPAAVSARSGVFGPAGAAGAALQPVDPGEQRLHRRLEVRRRRLDQRELELGAGVRAVLHRAERVGDQVQQAHDLRPADPARLLGQPLVLLGRDVQLGRDVTEHLHDHQRPGVGLEVAEEAPDVPPRLGQPRRRRAARERASPADTASTAPKIRSASAAPSTARTSSSTICAPLYDSSCSSVPERVAERARGRPGDQRDRLVGDLDRLAVGHAAQHRGDLRDRRAAEVEAVAAVHDRREDLVGLRGRQHEDRVRRRLLERLEERIPRLRREHVRLVEDVDLVAAADRRVRDALTQVADVVDGVVRGRVHLHDVERLADRDRDARLALAARRHRRPAVGAVQRSRQDLRHGGLPGPPRADEQVRMVDAVLLDRVGERADDVLLPDHVCERAGAMTAVQRSGQGSVESSGATSGLGLRAAIAIPLGAALAWLLIGTGFLNYDTAYSLLWGGHPFSSDLTLTLSPTPHPLATLVGAVLSPLGDAAQPAWVVLAFLALGALAWTTYELGAHWFGPAAGVVAALLILTRVPVLSFGVRAYLDIPYVALVLGAILAEARGSRATLWLLALAGLLRPEAWLFSFAYVIWKRDARLLPLAASAPVLWMLHDWVLAGNPLHSLTYTQDNAETLQRITGLDDVPLTVPRRIGEILREPGLLAAATGGILVLALMRRRAALPIAAGVVSLGAFCVLAAAGLPILGRYLLLPAALLAVFAGAGRLRVGEARTRPLAHALGRDRRGPDRRVRRLRPQPGEPHLRPARRDAHAVRDPRRPAHDQRRDPLPPGRRPEPPADPARRAVDGHPAAGHRLGPTRATAQRRLHRPGERAGPAQLHARPARPEDPDGGRAARLRAGRGERLMGALRPLLKKVDRAPSVEVGLRGLSTSLTPVGRPRIAHR